MPEQKVVVIGSGIGGAASAALLSSHGYRVTVIERNKFAGGKTASYERDGFICDMGIHYTARGDRGPIGEVARRVSADLQFIKKDPFLRLMKGERSCDLPLNLTWIPSLGKLARLAEVKVKSYWGAFRAFRRLMGAKREQDVEPFDEMPLKEFLLSHTEDEEVHRLIDLFCGFFFGLSYAEASTGEFMWSFSTWTDSESCSYPKGGFREIAASFLQACKRFGGDVHYEEAARCIRVEQGRVLGVETERDFYPADVVVSNAGIKRTIEMAGRDQFDESYVSRGMGLKDSEGGVTIKYALDYKPMDIPMIFYYGQRGQFSKDLEDMREGKVPEDPSLWIPCPTLSDPDIAPKENHLLLVGTIVPGSLEKCGLAEQVLDKMEEKMQSLFPELYDHIIWKHRTNLDYINLMGGRGAGEVIGLGQRFDQVGKHKPDAKMPIEGLYLVGCDAGGRGVGTEQAADSALKVTERIIRSRESGVRS